MFEWDDQNAEHIARHGVDIDDVEDAFQDPRQLGMPVHRASAEQRWGLLAAAPGGRLLVIVYTRRHGLIRVITARDATAAEKRRYRRR